MRLLEKAEDANLRVISFSLEIPVNVDFGFAVTAVTEKMTKYLMVLNSFVLTRLVKS